MCGITGILRLGDKPLPPREVVERMASAIAHRGPDGFGDHRDEWVHIAAVRLSILDLEHGDQPAYNSARTVAAVQNGELYNFRPLARELAARGHELRSTGDTIVLPHLYEEAGVEMIQKLRGMFAFAVWDSRERRLLLGRDRMGIKPLFIAQAGEFLLFGSEIKAILASGLVSPQIDRDSLDDLFSLSYPCPPRTMFVGVEELLPAHRLIAQAGRRQVMTERYWRVPFVARGDHPKISRRDAAVEFRERLRERVRDHLQADVKVATYLSGGIDSSAITALVREAVSDPVESYTIAFPGQSLDESGAAAEAARAWGLRHIVVNCGAHIADLFPDSIFHTELPLQYPLALPFLALSAVVRDHGGKVILTGEGADEQLAGYDCFRLERVRGALDWPGLRRLKPAVYRRMFGWLGSPVGMAEYFMAVQSRPNKDIAAEFGGVRPPWYDVWNALDVDRAPLLSLDHRAVRPIERAPANFRNLVRDDIRELHPLDAALSVELETRLPSWTVLVDDRAAMANGVETRVPFLDHEIVEWIARLPPQFKLRGLEEKSILRDAMAGVLPDPIRLRKKRPFYSPIQEWFFSPKRPPFVDEHLSREALLDSELFAPDVVNSLRMRLDSAAPESFLKHRLEWLLILVLGCQVLHRRLIREAGQLGSSRAIDRMKRMSG